MAVVALWEMGRGQELVQAPRMIKHPLYETVDCYKRMGSCCRRKGRLRDSVSHIGMELNDFSLQGSSKESLRNPVATPLPQEDQQPACLEIGIEDALIMNTSLLPYQCKASSRGLGFGNEKSRLCPCPVEGKQMLNNSQNKQLFLMCVQDCYRKHKEEVKRVLEEKAEGSRLPG